jgi:exopolysaccharide biosynthesis protein
MKIIAKVSLGFIFILITSWLVLIFPSVWAYFICIGLFVGILFLFRKQKANTNLMSLIRGRKWPILVFAVLLALGMYLTKSFNSPSLSKFFFNEGELVINTNPDKTKNEKETYDFNVIHEDSFVRVQSLEISREGGLIRSVMDISNPNLVYFFEFSELNEFKIYANLQEDSIIPVTCQEALTLNAAQFAVNTNFYDSLGRPEGGFKIDSVYYQKDGTSDDLGFLKIINGKPLVGSREYFKKIKGTVNYSSQAFPWIIDNGIIHPKFDTIKKSHKHALRNVIGTKNGKLVCILSNNGAYLSIAEIAEIAMNFGLDQASCFDGGFPRQYEYNSERFKTSFVGNNNTLSIGYDIENLILENVKSRIYQKSPVFLIVKGG